MNGYSSIRILCTLPKVISSENGVQTAGCGHRVFDNKQIKLTVTR